MASAGLLTYPLVKQPSHRRFPAVAFQKLDELKTGFTAAGLSGILTRFPF